VVSEGGLDDLDGWPRPDRFGLDDQRAVVELAGFESLLSTPPATGP
jgi:hypothetical protein